jgi:hypothetical protein
MAKVNKKVVAKKAETKPVAQAAAPAPAPTPKATATAKPAATPAASINRGRTTGMRVMQFQDQLLADNMKAKLTDAQLLEAMRKEFPNAKGKIFTADQETRLGIMRVVRRLFNEGRLADHPSTEGRRAAVRCEGRGGRGEAASASRCEGRRDARQSVLVDPRPGGVGDTPPPGLPFGGHCKGLSKTSPD